MPLLKGMRNLSSTLRHHVAVGDFVLKKEQKKSSVLLELYISIPAADPSFWVFRFGSNLQIWEMDTICNVTAISVVSSVV